MAVQGGITVTIHGLDNLRGKLKSSRADGPAARFLDRGAIFIQGAARRHVKVDTGRTRNSISVESPSTRTRRIGPNTDWAEHLETGTRPHWPPPGALAGWAQRHGVAEYAIRRKIGLYGTKAQPYMTPAAEESVPFIRSLIPILAAELESAFAQ